MQAEELVTLYREGFEDVDPLRECTRNFEIKQVHEQINKMSISSVKALIIIYEHYPLNDNITQHLLAVAKHKLSIKEKMAELASLLKHAATMAETEHKQKVKNKPSILNRISRR